MATLAIKGHATCGSEVIGLLEMLGGINDGACTGSNINKKYVLAKNNVIDYIFHNDCTYDCITFTLEQFLEKFPYKVGDKVYHIIHNKEQIITNMVWGKQENEVIYQTDNDEYSFVNYLQPYKEVQEKSFKESIEESMEENKGILIGLMPTPKGHEIVPNKGYEIKQYGERFYAVKKQPQYPKTYEDCEKILLERASIRNNIGYKGELLVAFQRLLVCRDAYWKIAGEKMGLGKPWVHDWTNSEFKYCIKTIGNKVEHLSEMNIRCILAFPTAEIRDVFYENFKGLIEECKELL